MACFRGCFEGVSGGQQPQAKKSQGSQRLEEQKQASAQEIDDFHVGLDFIGKVPLFRSLPLPDHPIVAKAFKAQNFKNGESVIKQGDVGDRFFCIKSGSAKVIVDGKQENKLNAGDYFGEQALLLKAPRNATVEADGDLECQTLSQQDFDDLGLRQKLRFQGRKGMIQKDDPRVGTATKKTPAQAALMVEAIHKNVNIGPFLKDFSDRDLQDIVDQAFAEQVTATTTEVITQGDLQANLFYILEKGSGVAIKDGVQVASYTSKDSFGGLALLYQAPRAATVRVAEGSKLWCIPRAAMRGVLQAQVKNKVEMYAQILAKVKCLDHVSTNDKRLLADALLETTYYRDELIIKEGEAGGRTFYILETGELSVMQRGQQVTTYKAGEGRELPHFGERALITDEPRAASVLVKSEKATVLVLDRDVFLQVVQPRDDSLPAGAIKYEYDKLQTICLLGCGGFGKVSLVKDGKTGKYFALKALSKGHVLREGQQSSVMNEKKILRMTHSPFLVQVAATFNKKEHLLFLLEPAMGGELFTIYIRNKFYGNEALAKFYSACVLKGLEHLHERYIIYRDMKPENLLLDQKGYCKIADFGLAKFVIGKTFTTCGTPDYFAPELLKGSGHTVALDWWTLGILVYEFMQGVTPFQADDPSQLFSKMMKGIETADFPRAGNWPDLVKGMCKIDPSERLAVRAGGINNVVQHKWYKAANFDWTALMSRTMPAPWDPKVKKMDGSNFDASEEDAPPDIPYKDPGTGWDQDFEDLYGPSTFD